MGMSIHILLIVVILCTHNDEYGVEDVSKVPQRYLQWLYHPICISETSVNQYRIHHKLGLGGFSDL